MARVTVLPGMFRQVVTVDVVIHAPDAVVWALLVDAQNFPEWNSTIVSMSGTIAEGGKVELVGTASDRTFSLTVSDVVPKRSMTWSDGMAPVFRGVRTFSITPVEAGVRFVMEEVFSGVLLPLVKPSLPDFRPIFEAYALDLKRTAEAAA